LTFPSVNNNDRSIKPDLASHFLMHLPRRTILFAPLVLSLAACEKETAATRPATLVRTELVQPQSRQSVIRLTGDVQAQVSTELSFRVSGRVTDRLVDVGAHVNAGDVLARIDPTEQQADIDGAKAAVAAAEAQLRVATATFERQKTLLANGFTTRPSYDLAQEGLRTAEGSLETAKAQLGTSTDALTNTELRANAAGIITARNIEVGQVVQSAQSAYTLAEDGTRDAVFDVYESIFLQPLAGDTIKVTLVSDPSITALGRPREISPTVDPKSATVRVKMAIQNPPPAMTLGSAITGEGRTKPADKIVLPWNALTAALNGPAVWVVDPKTNAVSLRDIVVETYETNSFVVSGGLTVGERVVTDGGKLLRPGQTVTYDGGSA
jgi:RND family efflux transporter MFP subunit